MKKRFHFFRYFLIGLFLFALVFFTLEVSTITSLGIVDLDDSGGYFPLFLMGGILFALIVIMSIRKKYS